ncbi:hypothetical protein [Streptomyces sp. TBY4]|uniref:hypothetical protein n=1 Tax=Streptomyces sp. TBY4 TaxID=2962030 RepID=UPI0020B707CB|nr:hypothetical protein [Streptomyces sp. TBY4]MCP3754514.1 hypothetical protein [Streptomyces sp. TBY4]
MALGVVLVPMIFAIGVLVVCVAIACFQPKETRVGCLLTSGGLLCVCLVTVAWFFLSVNTGT